MLTMVQVSNRYIENCMKSCGGMNSTIKCDRWMDGWDGWMDGRMHKQREVHMTEGKTICLLHFPVVA